MQSNFLREALLEFYSDKGIKIEFLFDFSIHTISVKYINNIRFIFVVPFSDIQLVSIQSFGFIADELEAIEVKFYDVDEYKDLGREIVHEEYPISIKKNLYTSSHRNFHIGSIYKRTGNRNK